MAVKKTLSILCVVALGALAGCAVGAREPVPAYAGPLRPAEQLAVFECGFGIRLKQIDGNRKFAGEPVDCAYALLPGRHEFRVTFTTATAMTSGWRSENDYMVTLTLVAGRTYGLHAAMKDERDAPMPWIVRLSDSSSVNLIDVTTVRELR